MINKIHFPVILFDKFGTIQIIKTIDKLCQCTKTSLKNNCFSNLNVIDSKGIKFKILNAKKSGTIGPFWGYNIFLEQRLKVELKFSKKMLKIELNDIKEIILNTINKDLYFWESGGNLTEIIDEIKTSENIKDLIDYLDNLINKEYDT